MSTRRVKRSEFYLRMPRSLTKMFGWQTLNLCSENNLAFSTMARFRCGFKTENNLMSPALSSVISASNTDTTQLTYTKHGKQMQLLIIAMMCNENSMQTTWIRSSTMKLSRTMSKLWMRFWHFLAKLSWEVALSSLRAIPFRLAIFVWQLYSSLTFLTMRFQGARCSQI